MAPSKAALLLAISLCISVSPCTLATKPLVTAITKDPATLLYTSPLLKDRPRHPLVLDLAGPLIWTTCAAAHPTFECHHRECAHAHGYHPPSCPHSGYGRPDDEDRFRCRCTAHPHNPVSGATGTDDLTRTALALNATDGTNPLYPVSFTAVASCAPRSLLAKLPAGAAGVAGLASSRLALPAQVARTQKVPKKFLLCLPRVGDGFRVGDGVAIFGGGPFFPYGGGLGGPDVTLDLTYTSLVSKKHSPAYYLPVKSIAVGGATLRLPGDALALATGGVALSTTVPYTALRPDVYRRLIDALDVASGWKAFKVPPVAPFELCYNSSFLPNTLIGHLAPNIDLVLPDGKNYTIDSRDSMVDLFNIGTACFAFVEMKTTRYAGAPAVEIGGYQMEDNALQFDLEKMQLGFARVPVYTSCTNFNFTQPGHH